MHRGAGKRICKVTEEDMLDNTSDNSDNFIPASNQLDIRGVLPDHDLLTQVIAAGLVRNDISSLTRERSVWCCEYAVKAKLLTHKNP